MIKLLFTLFLIGLVGGTAQAGDASQPLTSRPSSMSLRILGGACNTLEINQRDWACNSAMLALPRENTFTWQNSLGNNVSYVDEVRDLINGDAQAVTVEKLFNENRRVVMELNSSLGFQGSLWAVDISPSRYTYFSYVRNAALPSVAVHAMQESSLRLAMAGFAETEWAFGIQARLAKRKFVSNDVFIVELVGATKDELLPVHEQTALYLEPSALWQPDSEESWRPHISFTVENLGFVDEKHQGISMDPVFNLGAGFTGELERGDFSVGVNYALNSSYIDELDPLTLGATLGVGFVRFGASLGKLGYGFGFFADFKYVSLATSYEDRRLNLIADDDRRNQLLFTQIGLGF